MANRVIKPTRHPESILLSGDTYQSIFWPFSSTTIEQDPISNTIRQDLISKSNRIVNPRPTYSGGKQHEKKKKKRSLYLRKRHEVSTLQNHQGSKPSILLFFSFFWRCTARTSFDSRRTVYVRVSTQIQGDEGFGTYTPHAATTSLIIPSARVTGSVCGGVAYSALSNGFGAAQTSRHVYIFVLLVLRLAMILVERYIRARPLDNNAESSLGQRPLLLGGRGGAGRPTGHAIGRRRRLVVAESFTERSRDRASHASFWRCTASTYLFRQAGHSLGNGSAEDPRGSAGAELTRPTLLQPGLLFLALGSQAR